MVFLVSKKIKQNTFSKTNFTSEERNNISVVNTNEIEKNVSSL